jgi:hypothetical protein
MRRGLEVERCFPPPEDSSGFRHDMVQCGRYRRTRAEP